MARTLFLAGTDTGVGKTVVGAALLVRFRALGIRAIGVKPVETGCALDASGALIAEDGLRLAAASAVPPEPITPYRFVPPVAPVVAARAAKQRLEIAMLAAVAAEAQRNTAAELVLVEPAGGALSPIADDGLGLDLAVALGATVLLVARDTLGTQGQVLLALEAIRRRALEIAGVVLCRIGPEPPDALAAQDNLRMIEERGGVPVLAVIPRASTAEVVDQAARAMGALPEMVLAALDRP